MTLTWLVLLVGLAQLALLGELVRQARRTAAATREMAGRLDYLEGLLTGLAADVDALLELQKQESEIPVLDPDDFGGSGQEH
jgi:hypothetical protein